MPRPTEQHLEAAKRLLAQQSAGSGEAARSVAAEALYLELFQLLAPVLGAAGFRALFLRSLKQTQSEFSCLEAVLTMGEPLETIVLARRLSDCSSELEPAQAAELAVVLYGRLLGLITSFIGERLVSQILKVAFPEIDDSGSKETE